MSSNDAWIRDCGPTFVIDAKGRRRGVDWTFNAWGGFDGGLYFPWDRDDEVGAKGTGDRRRRSLPHAVRARRRRHPRGRPGHLPDHRGVPAQPESQPAACRAPRSRTQLRRYLGVTTVIWLGKGVYLDETGGHIDELACFTSPGHVASDLDRRSQGSAIRNFPGCVPAPEKGARCARPAADHAQDSSAGAALHDAPKRRPASIARAAAVRAGRRALAGVVHQFLYRQQVRRHAAVRQALRCGGRNAHAQAAVSDPPGAWASRPARYCSAAAIFTALPSKSPGPAARRSA